MEKGLLPISFLATTSAAPDPERHRRLAELVSFFPSFFFFPLLFLPRPVSSPRQDALCAASRSSAWPPGGAPPPAVCAPRAAGPPPSARPAGRRRHARRGAPAARGLWDYVEAELLGPTELGPRAGWGAGRGTPAEDGWPRLRAPAVCARPPAAAAVRPGHGQSPRGRRHGRTLARFRLARRAAAREVYMAGLNLHPHPGKCLARCPPPVVSSGSWEGGPGKVLGPFPPPHPRRSQRGFGPSFSLGRSTGCSWVAGRLSSRAGETPGPGAEASLEAPVERGAQLSCLPRRFGPSQGARVCRKRSHQGLFQTPGSCNSSLGWSFQNLGEKRTDQLHTL